MGDYNYDGHFEGDWEDRGEYFWGEREWQQFLQRQEEELVRFVTYYNSLCEEPGHLDSIALKMGWDAEDWSVADDGGDTDDLSEPDPALSMSDTDPYTLHRHPVYVVITALYAQLRYNWLHALETTTRKVTPTAIWNLTESLRIGESNGVMALQALDMGDYLLAICHFKRMLTAINESMRQLEWLAPYSDAPEAFLFQGRIRLFDLREVCLRSMYDCREEARRSGPGEQD